MILEMDAHVTENAAIAHVRRQGYTKESLIYRNVETGLTAQIVHASKRKKGYIDASKNGYVIIYD